MEKFRFLPKAKISKLPKTTGVYCFKSGRELLYIGKAINVRERVKQHKDVLGLAKHIGYIKTDSEIEALILEANLIKKYQPKYNVVWKDDKNYFYVAATKESFPQIFLTHQIHQYENSSRTVGPFVDGKALKETLKVLRKVFPYRSCNRLPKHACLWYQIQRCPAPCLVDLKIPGFKEKMKRDCKKNAENLMTTLTQGKNSVLNELKKEMAALSKQQRFEEAGKIRNQIQALEKIISHARIFELDGAKEVQPLLFYRRVEAYDIANIQGKMATGAMVVFIDGKPDKSQYRQFKIKGAARPNDIAMLKEVLERRLKHQEWPYPDLILIDGGRAQLNVAIRCLTLKVKHIKVMAIAKKNNELYMEGEKKPVLLKTLPRETFNLILQLRDEAHRFARRYHHKLRKEFLLK